MFQQDKVGRANKYLPFKGGVSFVVGSLFNIASIV